MKIYNVFSKRAIIPNLPQLDVLLEEQALSALNELSSVVAEGEGVFSRIISIKNAKKKGYFEEETKEETIRAWIKTGEIPASCVKKIGKKYFLVEHKLLSWLLENESEFDSEGGEEKNVNDSKKRRHQMWSKPQEKTKRCRLSLGANFFIISDPLKNGKESFRLEYRDSNQKRRCLRLKKSFVKTREQAVAAAEKEIERMGKIGKIANPYSAEASIPNVAGDYTIAQIAEKFLFSKKKENIKSYNILKTAIENRLEPFFGNIPMSKLNLHRLKDYRDMRRETVEDVSIKNDLACLRLVYSWAIEEEIYSGRNPVKIGSIKLHIKERQRYMTKEEEEKIWKVLKGNPLLKDLATFALNVPMRPHNVVDLMWPQINFDDKAIVIPASQHKQGVEGNYPLNNTNLDLLKRRKKGSDNELVFHFENGRKVFMKWIQKNWKNACEEAGVKDLHFYDLKHSLLSRLARNGSNVWILKRISNHASVNSLEKYVKMQGLTEAALTAMNSL